jgi:hypothetical protein
MMPEDSIDSADVRAEFAALSERHRAAVERMWLSLAALGESQMAQGLRLQSGGQSLVLAAEQHAVAAEFTLECGQRAGPPARGDSPKPLVTSARECFEAAVRARQVGESLIERGRQLVEAGRKNLTCAKAGLLCTPGAALHAGVMPPGGGDATASPDHPPSA